MSLEYERKYAATEDALHHIAQKMGDPTQVLSMETTYYDTRNGALSRQHITLRRRIENGVGICTLKTPTGTLARGEFQVEAASIEEALPMLCKLSDYKELLALTADGVFPVCGAKFTRRAYRVSFGDSMLEIALDQGVLLGGKKECPLFEVEVELLSGKQEDADLYGTILSATYALQEENKSKFRRALDLAKGEN